MRQILVPESKRKGNKGKTCEKKKNKQKRDHHAKGKSWGKISKMRRIAKKKTHQQKGNIKNEKISKTHPAKRKYCGKKLLAKHILQKGNPVK